MELNLDLLTSILSAMEDLRGETDKPTLASSDGSTEGEADELLAQIDRNIVRIKKLLDRAAANCSSSNIERYNQKVWMRS